MTRKLLLPLLAAAALGACNSKSHTIVAPGPDEGNTVDLPQNVVLPPSITATKTYRCANNKILYIDWMSDGSARVKKSKDEAGTTVAPGAAELKGESSSSAITYQGQSCKA